MSHMKARDAARTLGITIDAVYRLLWSGKLAGRRASDDGDWQVDRDAVFARLNHKAKRKGIRANEGPRKPTKEAQADGHGTHRAAH